MESHKNCKGCRFITEVAGGSKLGWWCKIKNEKIFFPSLEGRFCSSHKSSLDNEEVSKDDT